MRRILLALVVLATLALPVAASEPFVALVDLERGLLLIPEGTAVPRGVELVLDGAPARAALDADAAPVEATPRRFVYAYAPGEKFVEPRQRIAAIEAEQPAALKADDLPPMAGVVVDHTYYYYFPDGSWHGARKFSYYDDEFGNQSYIVQTFSYAAGGDFDTRVTVSQSSTQYSYFTTSKSCWFYGSDGTCNTNGYGFIAAPGQSFSATITSRASMVQYFYPPCDFPCKDVQASSIVINFP